MTLIMGTNDGVWTTTEAGCERVALADTVVTHVAARGGAMLAAVPREGLYHIAAAT